MNTAQSADMQIFDIYEVIYTPWWQQWWFLVILSIMCISIGYFGFIAYKKYLYKKSLYVDFFTYAHKHLALLKEKVAKDTATYDVQQIYDELLEIFKHACLHYCNMDLSRKTIVECKQEFENKHMQSADLAEFLDVAQHIRFGKSIVRENVQNHIEYIENFLNEIAQHKAIKQK